MSAKRLSTCFVIGACWFLFQHPSSAHNGYESEVEVRIHADRLEASVRAGFPFAWKLLGPAAPVEMDGSSKASALPVLNAAGRGLLAISSAGKPLEIQEGTCDFEVDDHVTFFLTYQCPSGWPLEIRARYLDLFDSLTGTTVRVYDQRPAPYRRDIEPLATAVLMKNRSTATVAPTPPTGGIQPPEGPVREPARDPQDRRHAFAVLVGAGTLTLLWVAIRKSRLSREFRHGNPRSRDSSERSD